ncbi:MAG: nuclear transport factor 2 family protein [Deltaproteobacteria bacterium]|nr:nuclear transport factor 2 family protein [Deltaproteobacteria bacterium]
MISMVVTVALCACETVSKPVETTPAPTPRPDKPIVVQTETPSQTGDMSEDEVRAFLLRLELAWQTGDTAALETIYTPDAEILVNTGQHARTLTAGEYLKLAAATRARLADYRYRVEESRITVAADVATVVENIAEEGRDKDRVIRSDTDAAYTIVRFENGLRISRVEAKVLTATPGE